MDVLPEAAKFHFKSTCIEPEELSVKFNFTIKPPTSWLTCWWWQAEAEFKTEEVDIEIKHPRYVNLHEVSPLVSFDFKFANVFQNNPVQLNILGPIRYHAISIATRP